MITKIILHTKCIVRRPKNSWFYIKGIARELPLLAFRVEVAALKTLYPIL